MQTKQGGRKTRTFGVVLLVALGVVQVWAQAGPPLGVSVSQAQNAFGQALENGSPSYYLYARAFNALPPAGRVAAVEAGFTWARSWGGSDAFQKAYATRREEVRPVAPTFKGTVDDELKAIEEKEAADREQTLAALPPAQREQLAAAFQQVAAMQKDPQFVAMRREGLTQDRARAQRTYQDDLRHWEEDFPANPQVLVARRLRQFLEVSADVDYSAELVTRDGLRRFANSAYERKPSEWKLCFRAGREATTAARNQAESWLRALSAR